MSFDVQLMAETSEKIIRRQREDLQSPLESHGPDFAISVMGNLGVDMICGVLSAAKDDDARSEILAQIMVALARNTMVEMSNYETEELLDRIKKGAKQ